VRSIRDSDINDDDKQTSAPWPNSMSKLAKKIRMRNVYNPNFMFCERPVVRCET
jgi:hypothetical protein